MGIRNPRKDTSHLVIQKILYLHLIPLSSLGRGWLGCQKRFQGWPASAGWCLRGLWGLEVSLGLTGLEDRPRAKSQPGLERRPRVTGWGCLGGLSAEAGQIMPMGVLRALVPFFSVGREISHPRLSLVSPSSTPSLQACLYLLDSAFSGSVCEAVFCTC